VISFLNEPELGVFTCAHVDEGAPALLVLHGGDHSWTFCCGGCEQTGDDEEPAFVHVHHLVELDATLDAIAAVPPGHAAERDAPGAPWRVASISRRPAARP
jgi:hypothetical protein